MRKIESGAQWRVFCARDDDTGACYAVQLFHSNGDRFEAERDVLYQLNHPNVIRIVAECVVQLVVMELGSETRPFARAGDENLPVSCSKG
jgi:hypothetical protein